jgi:hypothetical protein
MTTVDPDRSSPAATTSSPRGAAHFGLSIGIGTPGRATTVIAARLLPTLREQPIPTKPARQMATTFRFTRFASSPTHLEMAKNRWRAL